MGFQPSTRIFMVSAAVAVIAAGLGVGLGALIFGGEGNGVEEQELLQARAELRLAESRVETLEDELDRVTATPTPSPSPTPIALPGQSADWDPCVEPGLCEFVTSLDEALVASDIYQILDMVGWRQMDCTTTEESALGWQPSECASWPFPQPVPFILVGIAGADASFMSRWRVYDLLEQFVGATELTCDGMRTKLPKRVHAIMLPPEQNYDWWGEVSVLVGPELSCEGTNEDTLMARAKYSMALRRDDSGEWKIVLMHRTGISHLTEDFYPSEFRYYPMN